MSIQYQIFLGTDTNGHMPEAEARQLAFDLAAQYFPHGHSIREEMGRWQLEDGTCVTELTVVITWISTDEQDLNGDGRKKVSGIAGAYKTRAHQEAVLVTEQAIEAILY